MKTAGRLETSRTAMQSAPSMKVRVEDGGESVDTVGRKDAGSYEFISSPCLVDHAVLNDIGKTTKIEILSLEVALKKIDKAQLFSI